MNPPKIRRRWDYKDSGVETETHGGSTFKIGWHDQERYRSESKCFKGNFPKYLGQ